MTVQPTPDHIHIWDGTPTLPAWITLGQHSWDGTQFVIHHGDHDAYPQPGWWLIGWSDGMVTVASPQVADREYGPDGIYARAQRAEAALGRVQAVCDQLRRASVLADGEPHTDRERGIMQAVSRVLAALDEPAREPAAKERPHG